MHIHEIGINVLAWIWITVSNSTFLINYNNCKQSKAHSLNINSADELMRKNIKGKQMRERDEKCRKTPVCIRMKITSNRFCVSGIITECGGKGDIGKEDHHSWA